MGRALILGDGPSANLLTVRPASDVTVIATHNVYASAFRTSVADFAVINDAAPFLKWQNVLPHKSPTPVLRRPLAEKYGGYCVPFDIDFPNSGKPQFSERGPLNLYSLNTGCLAIQFAYQQGAREIGLLGMDLYYTDDSPSHAFGDLRGSGDATDANFGRALEWFAAFSDRFHGDNPLVLNLNPDAKTPLRNYLDYDSLANYIE